MNTAEIINHVNQLTSTEEISLFAADVFDKFELDELDDAVLEAMETRVSELYTPNAKEIARANWVAGCELFKKYSSKGNNGAMLRQVRKNKKLRAIYDSLNA